MPDRQVEISLSFTQQDFDDFAQLSADHNPIHVDPDFAARTPFRLTVAHGMLLYTRLQGLLMTHWPDAIVRAQDLMFPAPTLVDEPVRLVLSEHLDACGSPHIAMRIHKANGQFGLDGRALLTRPHQTASGSDENSPVPSAFPRLAALKVGQSASRRHQYSHADLLTWRRLAGLTRLTNNRSPSEVSFGLTHNDSGHTIEPPMVGAMFSCLLGETLPGHGTNYLKQSLVIHHLPCVNTRLCAKVTVQRIRGEKALVDLLTTCHDENDRLLVSGRALVRFHY